MCAVAGVADAHAQAVLQGLPNPLDFGDQRVGVSSPTEIVTVSNTGISDTSSLSFTITGADAAAFTIVSEPTVIASLGSGEVEISFTPTHSGAHTASLDFEYSPPNSSGSVALAGNGIAPDMQVSIVGGASPPLDFGASPVGVASATTYTIRVHNAGDDVLNGALSESGHTADWSYAPSNATFTVAPGANRDIVATFTPQAAGSRAATLRVRDVDAFASPVDLAFTGTGTQPDISVAPDPVTFAARRVLTTSPTTMVVITNDGNGPLDVSSIGLTSGHTADFSLTLPMLPDTLAPAETLAFSVAFTPQTTGTRTATVTIGSNDPDEASYALTVTGTGQAPVLSVSPTSLAFGNRRVGTSSPAQSFTISNTGDSSMTVTGVSIPGANAEDWSLSGFTGTTMLAGGASMTIDVVFAPLATGAQNATVVVTTTNPLPPATANVSLTGTGTQALLALTPAAGHDFGDVVVNTSSTNRSFVLENTGTATLTVSGLTISGSGASHFQLVSPPATPFTIAPGNTRTINVRCRPTSVGSKAATFAVASDADNAASVPTPPLACRGVKPDVTVTPSSLSFPATVLGSTSPAQTITVSNAALATTSPATVSIARVGTNPGDFGATPTSFTLAAGESRTVSVTFSPTVEGARSAIVRVTSDDQETPTVDVAVSGNGVKPEITLVTPTSIDFGDVPVSSSSAPSTITVRNDGSSDLTITGISISGSSAGQFSIVSGSIPPPNLVLAPAATASWQVVFNPSSTGTKIATFRINSDDADEALKTVGLTGNGVEAQLTVTPSPIAFPATRVCEDAASITVEMRNTGTFALTITDAMVSGGVFPVTAPPTLPATLDPNEATTMQIGFVPTMHADYGGSLTVVSDAPGGDVSVPITGPGRVAEMTVTPTTHDFGDVRVDEPAVTQLIVIKNTSTAPFTVMNAVLSDPAHFTMTVQSPASLPAVRQPAPAGPSGTGEEVVLRIDALPTAAGVQMATVTITTDIPTCMGVPAMSTVTLRARGVAPDIELSPVVNFGGHDVQSGTPLVRPVTIDNPGTAPLEVTGIAIDGLFAGDYALAASAPALPFTVPVGGSVDVDVEFQPGAERPCGTESAPDATATITSDAISSPASESLLIGCGFDRHIRVMPADVEFPPTYRYPDEPVEVAVQIHNDGDATLRVLGSMASGTDAAAFEIVGGAGQLTVSKGAPEEIRVRFYPTQVREQPWSALLLIQNDDDDAGMLSAVPLRGLSVAREVMVGPDMVPFGDTPLDTSARIQGRKLELINMRSDRAFTVRELRVTGGDDAYRIVGFDGPRELPALGRLELDIEFTPTEEKMYMATVEVFLDGDPLVHREITLLGFGVNAQLLGSGCDAGGGAGAGGAVLVLLVLALALRRRAAVLVALLAVGGSVQAEPTRNLDLSTFRPAVSGDPELITVETPAVGAHGTWALGVYLDWAQNPLNLQTTRDGMVDVEHPVSQRTTTMLAGSYALRDRYELGLGVPLLTQSGDVQMLNFQAADGTALGDVTLYGKARLLASGPMSLGSSVAVTAPTASDDEFAGADGFTGHVRVIAGLRTGGLQLAANGGLRLRPGAELRDVRQGNELTFGLGGSYALGRTVAAVGELYGALGLGAAQSRATSPLEAIGGLRWRATRSVAITVGGGRGILPGIGAPSARAFFQVAYTPGASALPPPSVRAEGDRHDEDDDIEYEPETARDVGDNDADQIINADDKCPNDPEDRDGFQDDDGCPDFDNDGDGVLDDRDQCPNKPEDRDGVDDDDGCPDGDDDGDGIPDARDKCPGEAEDIDGYQDHDGCPDFDNDGDGIPDIVDACTMEPETINGVEDSDGCPDEGTPSVVWMGDRLELAEPIEFTGNSATIARSSRGVLEQLGALLRAHPEWTKIEIGVHVHPRGGSDTALSRKRAAAVRKWLIDFGIDPSRIETQGYGSARPLVPPGSRGARKKNDRVEISITNVAE